MSCCISFGKPIALMHNCITTNGMESKYAARYVNSKWMVDFVSMAFSIDMFIRSIALYGLRPFRAACWCGGLIHVEGGHLRSLSGLY